MILKFLTHRRFNHIDAIALTWCGIFLARASYILAVICFFGGMLISAIMEAIAKR